MLSNTLAVVVQSGLVERIVFLPFEVGTRLVIIVYKILIPGA